MSFDCVREPLSQNTKSKPTKGFAREAEGLGLGAPGAVEDVSVTHLRRGFPPTGFPWPITYSRAEFLETHSNLGDTRLLNTVHMSHLLSSVRDS